MWKENKGKIILSSIGTLLPVFAGLLLWNKLPDTMISHWGIDGTADGFMTKSMIIIVPFVAMLLVNWLCLWATFRDPGNKGQSRKAMGMIYWIIPMISIFAGCMIYSNALGWRVNPVNYSLPIMGLLFIIIGNYLPKCKQNMTLGIKISWTLQNEENWNKTHRFAGKVWVMGGFLMMISMFFPKEAASFLMLGSILVLVFIPVLYSYLLYRRQKKEGTWELTGTTSGMKVSSLERKLSVAIGVPILILVVVLLFTGDIDYSYGEESFTIKADYWTDVTIKYENIESVTYREDVHFGSRTGGFGSLRLGMGNFENDEFGSYTRYCYETCSACVVLEIGNKKLVINGKDDAATKELYNKLQEEMR